MTESTARRRRWPWIVLAAVLAVPLALLGAAWLLLDADSLKPRLVAAVERATGRQFTVGEMRVALSLSPTVELRDVTLANMEGGSRPQMLTARRVEVQAALLPLLSNRVEVTRIELEEPDLLLERTADGRANWGFRPPEGPQAADPGPAAPEGTPRARPDLGIDRLEVTRARITWRDAASGLVETAEFPAVTARLPRGGEAAVEGTLAARGQEVRFSATTGPLSAFGGAQPWPFRGTVAAAGAEATGNGTLAAGGAWALSGEARAADLARLAPLLPDMPLPPLREVRAAGRATGEGRGLRSVADATLTVGESDLSVLRPGLTLRRFEAAVPALDQPVRIAGEAVLGGRPLRLSGTAGAPALLREGTRGPMPLDLRLETEGAAATLRGRVADPWAVSGVNLTVTAEAADLAALSPLAGTPLPPLRELRASTRVEERTARFEGGAHLHDLRVASSAGEVAGELTLVVGERPGLTGRLASPRLDLDALRAAAPGPASAAQPSGAPAPAAERDGRVIPAVPLPVGALRTFDADLDIRVAELVAGGQPWRQVAAKVGIEAGRARIAPVSARTPAGPLTLEIEADARQEPAAVRLVARSPGLDLAALQAALGQPNRVTGSAELDADLRGRGGDTRAMAATLGGHLGIAVLEGHLEPALVEPIVAGLRQRVPVLPALPSRLPYECIAIRAEAADGVARIGTLLLDAPAAKVAGSGTVNLREETLALRLLHDVRAAGQTVRVAADLGGTLANPRYGGVQAQNLGEVIGGLAGRLGGDAGALLGALARPGGRVEPLPDCGPALAAARGGRAGRVPQARPAEAPTPAPEARPAAPAVPGVPRELQGPAGELLRGLFGR
jgi:AsmA protein